MPFCSLMVFTVILLTAPQAWFPALAPLRLALLAAMASITTHVYQRSTAGGPIMVRSREMSLVAGIAGWALLTIPLSYWPGGSLSFLTGLYLKTLAIFWLLANTVNTVARLRWMAWVLSLASVPIAQVAVSNFRSGTFLGGSSAVKRIAGYEAPLTQNPNDLALLLNIILPLSVALALSIRHAGLRVLLVAIVALDAVAIIVTFSRTGFLTLSTTLLVYLWRLWRRPSQRYVGAAIFALALAALPLLPSGYWDRVATIVDIDSDPSSQARWRDTVAAAGLVMRNPIIGAGIGQNTLALNEERGEAWTEVHNTYLEYAVELGLPGLVMFVLLLLGSLRTAAAVAANAAERAGSSELFHLAQGIQGSLIAFAFAALFHPAGYHFYFYYLAGLAIAARTVSERTV